MYDRITSVETDVSTMQQTQTQHILQDSGLPPQEPHAHFHKTTHKNNPFVDLGLKSNDSILQKMSTSMVFRNTFGNPWRKIPRTLHPRTKCCSIIYFSPCEGEGDIIKWSCEIHETQTRLIAGFIYYSWMKCRAMSESTVYNDDLCYEVMNKIETVGMNRSCWSTLLMITCMLTICRNPSLR